jgi:hypothetical protein
MIAAFVDHLWQSWLCLVAIALSSMMLRRAPAQLRWWLWRGAALKFLVPFSLLYALGSWTGFPISHPGDTVPQALVQWLRGARPLVAPAQSATLHGAAAFGLLLFLLAMTLAWSAAVTRQIRIERLRSRREADRMAATGEPIAGIGFFRAGMLTLCGLSTVSGAVLSGAVDDRLHRHAVLEANLHDLRQAKIELALAKPGMGERSALFADAHGVRLRNVNVQEMIAFAFGVSRFAVMNNQTVDAAAAEPRDFWMYSPRYDVQISGPVREPEIFQSYALHTVMTRMLAMRFGLEIEVNGECQRPCGRWDTAGFD